MVGGEAAFREDSASTIVLDPVIVIGTPQEPKTPDDPCGGWICGGDPSDPDPGTGSGGGGGTAPLPPATCPDWDPNCDTPPAPVDDYLGDMSPPDCTKPNLQPWEHAYCTSTVPTGERLVRTLTGLQRIASRGGECATIAAFGQQLLLSGRIRYFAHVESIHGPYGGWGGPEIGAVLGAFWVDDFGGAPSGHPNFDNKLVHEIEHAMGRDHVDASGSDTPNSRSCSGF